MRIYNIKRTVVLPISIQQAWSFFSSPANLPAITPPGMQLRIIYASGDVQTYEGQIIRYQMRLIPFTTSEWVTEIKNVNPPFSFVDEQRFGPYRFWHHQHRFAKCDGGVEVIDEVNYSIPFGVLGAIANGVFVHKQLENIFNFRSAKLLELFRK
jgi:ligand-binding SRPBCC domain-containing protein